MLLYLTAVTLLLCIPADTLRTEVASSPCVCNLLWLCVVDAEILLSFCRHVDPRSAYTQVPCPPDDLDSPVSKKARAEVGQWQQQQSRSTATQQRQQAQQQQQQQAAAKRQSKDSSMVDMHQFWKYFHLVPAQVGILLIHSVRSVILA